MMCVCRLVYTVYVFTNGKVSQIFNIIGLSINMVMSTFTMMTETVKVLKPQV
jgi:hypothetical protein